MAYNFSNRFQPPPKYCVLLDPGAYQKGNEKPLQLNKAPFLSQAPRITKPGGKQLWTHALYDFGVPHKIQNCTSLKSKCPRFPYESFSKKDLKELLCRCGFQSECICPTEEVQKELLCQGKVRKRLFTGPTPKSLIGEGLSVPSKRVHGFEILSNGTVKRLTETVVDECPPYYDATYYESTAFYHGWKWSKWTSKRSKQSLEIKPGPADYFYVKVPTDYEICVEELRAHRRKTSRRLRFIEMVQQQHKLEGGPGPATYRPELPKKYKMHDTGAKAKRFITSTIEQRPGPADYRIKRTFDLPDLPSKPCYIKLSESSFFGVKDVRFKTKKEEGPSPATYSPILKNCNLMHCLTAPFKSSSLRFKEISVAEGDEEDEVELAENEKTSINPCRLPTWQFKSKTIRFKHSLKKVNAPSPADLPQSRKKLKRSRKLQTISPFSSSEGRFQQWNDWMPVFGKLITPGPCYYSLENPKCFPAVTRGPLCRSARFPQNKSENPSPNTYSVGGGVENVLATHNQILKNNIKAKLEFKWKPPLESRQLSYEEQEMLLIQKSIALLDTNVIDKNSDFISPAKKTSVHLEEMCRPKLLRCLL